MDESAVGGEMTLYPCHQQEEGHDHGREHVEGVLLCQHVEGGREHVEGVLWQHLEGGHDHGREHVEGGHHDHVDDVHRQAPSHQAQGQWCSVENKDNKCKSCFFVVVS